MACQTTQEPSLGRSDLGAAIESLRRAVAGEVLVAGDAGFGLVTTFELALHPVGPAVMETRSGIVPQTGTPSSPYCCIAS